MRVQTAGPQKIPFHTGASPTSLKISLGPLWWGEGHGGPRSNFCMLTERQQAWPLWETTWYCLLRGGAVCPGTKQCHLEIQPYGNSSVCTH